MEHNEPRLQTVSSDKGLLALEYYVSQAQYQIVNLLISFHR
jgi:hypothetical protein